MGVEYLHGFCAHMPFSAFSITLTPSLCIITGRMIKFRNSRRLPLVRLLRVDSQFFLHVKSAFQKNKYIARRLGH